MTLQRLLAGTQLRMFISSVSVHAPQSLCCTACEKFLQWTGLDKISQARRSLSSPSSAPQGLFHIIGANPPSTQTITANLHDKENSTTFILAATFSQHHLA